MDHYPILVQALLLDDRLTREGHEMNAMYCIQVRSELIPHKSNNTHEIQTFFARFYSRRRRLGFCSDQRRTGISGRLDRPRRGFGFVRRQEHGCHMSAFTANGAE